MKTYYEYEALNLRKNPVYIRKFNRHNSRGRVHWHEPLELLYFVEGTAITSCNLQEYKAKQGCILIVNGNELHTGIISQNNSAFYCIQFDPFFFHNLIGNEYVIFENFFTDKDCTDVLDRLISVYMPVINALYSVLLENTDKPFANLASPNRREVHKNDYFLSAFFG